MLVLLAGLFVVHIATAIMLFVSTIANVWMVADHEPSSVGLWKNCTSGNCDESPLTYGDEGAIKAVQAFMILAIIFSVISLVVFVFQLFTMEKGNRFFFSGSSMLVCWLCILVGVSIYTNHYAHSEVNFSSNGHQGYCFILTWICFCFSFIIGILYMVLRKNGGGPDPNHIWGWGSLLPSIHPWKKVVGYYANASLRPPEGPPLTTNYDPTYPQSHKRGALPAAVSLTPPLRVTP